MPKFKIQINNITSVDELPNYWSNEDYINLLEIFDFPDAQNIKKENMQEYLKMAITDIIWELEDRGNNKYRVVTSEYWINKSDFISGDFQANLGA